MSSTFLIEWIFFPILIFLAQLLIVSIATLRIIYLTKSFRLIATLLGLFEVSLWLFSVATVIQNLSNPAYSVAYILGFSVGNYLGIAIENRVASGIRLIRIITKKRATQLIKTLRQEKCRLTNVVATGEGLKKVNILYIIVQRKSLRHITSLIRHFHPHSFVSVEEINYLDEGSRPIFTTPPSTRANPLKNLFPRR